MKQYKEVKLDTITTRIPAELNIKIKLAAAKNGVPGSTIVRRALEAYFARTREEDNHD